MNNAHCSCGNFACNVRSARGLTPFCQMDRTAPSKIPAIATYPTFDAAAKAARPDQKPQAYRSMLDGGPRKFILVAR